MKTDLRVTTPAGSRAGTYASGTAMTAAAETWTAVAAPSDPGTTVKPAPARLRRHKATRCRHCAFARPREAACGGVRLCVLPGRDPLVVFGDGFACAGFAAGPPHATA